MVTTWIIGGVTFPFSPNQISDEVDAIDEKFDLDGVAAMIMGEGLGVRQVQISGSITGASKTIIENTYAAPLRGYQGTSRVVQSPSGNYDGTWLIKRVSFKETAESSTLSRITYSITLWKPAKLVVL